MYKNISMGVIVMKAVAYIVSFLILLLVLNPFIEVAQAQTPPQPQITISSSSLSMSVDDTRTMTFTVKNNGGATSDTSHASFTVSSGLEITSWQCSVSDMNFSNYPPGRQITNSQGQQFTSTYQLVEGYKAFGAGESCTVTITVKAKASGTHWIYYRSAMAPSGTVWEGPWYRDPSSSSTSDQQGFPVYKIGVSIVTPQNHPPNMPSNPSPPDSAINQSTSVMLSWAGGDPDGDEVLYYVYLGTSTPPPSRGGIIMTSFPVEDLNPNTTYYWQIVASDELSRTPAARTYSPIWSFTTRPLTSTPTPTPTPTPTTTPQTGQNDAGSGGDAGNSFSTALSIPAGSYSGYVDSSDRNDYYKVNVTSGSSISVSVTPPSNADFDLYLYNPSQFQVGSSTYGGSATDSVSYTGTSSGYYYVRIYQYSGSGTCSFTISVTGAPPTPQVGIIQEVRKNAEHRKVIYTTYAYAFTRDYWSQQNQIILDKINEGRTEIMEWIADQLFWWWLPEHAANLNAIGSILISTVNAFSMLVQAEVPGEMVLALVDFSARYQHKMELKDRFIEMSNLCQQEMDLTNSIPLGLATIDDLKNILNSEKRLLNETTFKEINGTLIILDPLTTDVSNFKAHVPNYIYSDWARNYVRDFIDSALTFTTNDGNYVQSLSNELS